ncbi:MAG TPA: hypothetical protein VMM93_11545 [Vicinamibacterales bacterium]|nr:hypothetical protein [Vicinamibacterales bacterium]
MRVLDEDAGAALVVVLIASALAASIGLGLVTLSNTERAIAANYQAAVESRHAAEAVLERALVDVRQAADLTTLTSGSLQSTFVWGGLTPVTPAGRQLDLFALTAAVQAGVDTTRWGADSPEWRLFAYGPLARLGVAGDVPSLYYGVVWLADDPADGDGNPSVDTNGVVMVLAESFGPGAVRHAVIATVEGAGRLVVRSWRDYWP